MKCKTWKLAIFGLFTKSSILTRRLDFLNIINNVRKIFQLQGKAV